jgi:rhomboid protease GluP
LEPKEFIRRRPFTFGLIAVLLAVYAVEIARSSPNFWLIGQGDLPDIAQWGVVFTPAIADGEVWRLITAGFLHAGLLHIALNVFALVIIGGAAEQRFGWWKTALIFFGAMFGGNLAAAAFEQQAASLGASGGVMGLAGAVVVAAYRSGEGLAGSQWIISAIVMTLAFGFINSGVSNPAHIGGLVIGALVGLTMGTGRSAGVWRPAGRQPAGRQPVNKRQVEFQRRIDEAMRKAAEERPREAMQSRPPERPDAP